MIEEKLALFGGPKTIGRTFKKYNPIGPEEVAAAKEVVESGVLSQYLGVWHADFYGGPKVQEFERASESYFNVKHAITVNSWTSGLVAAIGAIGIEPGDEVIVSPWTMSASATAILHWNAIPVFADIESRTFCLDPDSVRANITPYTKAIMAVDIFGHSANMEAICEIAQEFGLKVISDSAQSPSAKYHGRYAGTIADIGGFSLNYHKHIHTGEGGILVTDDDVLAEKLRLIRNHAEVVVGPKGHTDLVNMIGHNFRLGEIECAIGIEQLKKLDRLVASRQKAAERITEGLRALEGLTLPIVEEECTHVYYVYPMTLNCDQLGVSRERIVEALIAEGVEGLLIGYQNIHLLPMYQNKIAYGSKGFPWSAGFCQREVVYTKGICPVAEQLHDESYIGYAICVAEMEESEVELLVQAFRKVWKNMGELQ
ncbi:DegT/DnrJ/EryC1/StrS family aminotransferase [Haliea sp. E1-2-M8]|uniref:DegT/DnrJ/EryC1/StrS family aminotransferase n=1 Tax=Haliea sp. E1-2-M8 TaxID=3064706 RepID=UPI00271684CE|nr:DegT/DnrJ/EryC1/StrS family aminotransferase [Haliea sp. E1-2-M8]MDO8861661.1 DegT/DnrJ/EryC1/StrS family aminotransferase [Haliea sp. E1-2-M8]